MLIARSYGVCTKLILIIIKYNYLLETLMQLITTTYCTRDIKLMMSFRLHKGKHLINGKKLEQQTNDPVGFSGFKIRD